MADEREIEESLVSTIRLPDLGEAIADIGEVGLDQLIAEGAMRDIPVIGALIRLGKTVGAVRDFIFLRKVVRFFRRLSDIPVAEREEFVQQLEARQERRRVGETLVLLLDRLDDMDKPDMLARLFAGHVRGRYDFETFRQLATALDRLSLPTLAELRAFYEPERQGFTTRGDALTQLAAAGLVGFQFYPTSYDMTGGAFTKTDLGQLFLDVIRAVD